MIKDLYICDDVILIYIVAASITILYIIHRPLFYLKQLNSISLPYLTENTLRLRYEPNRLMISLGLWRRYINITITIHDIIHCPVVYLNTTFRIFPSSRGIYLVRPNISGPETETSLVD
jgi:hypothetical protein